MWVKRNVHSTIKTRNEVLLATLKLLRGQGRVSNCKQSINLTLTHERFGKDASLILSKFDDFNFYQLKTR